MAQAARPSRTSQTLQFAGFRVDLRARELYRNGTKVRLQEQPFQVLALLLEHAGEVVTREELRQHLWPADTFVDFDNSLNTAINKIREAIGDSAEDQHFIETLPRRGYRFIAPVEEHSSATLPIPSPQRISETAAAAGPLRRMMPGAVLVVLALSGAAYWAKQHIGHRLTEKDTILLADFANGTGDAVFDDTLKQALAVNLQQSPFLSLVSDQQTRETLRFMGRSPDERVTGGVAREICQRQGAQAVLQGGIGNLGSHYVLNLNALSCPTGESLAADQAEVEAKEQVLTALGRMAARMRGQLGESISRMEKYDSPLLPATTSSLEALKAYSLGVTEQEKGNDVGAIPFFKRATELDPSFALAFIRLYIADWDTGEYELGRESARTAFGLRERVTEREKLSISAIYHDSVTGDLQKIIEADRLWAKMYPREWIPHDSLAGNYNIIGFFPEALEEAQTAVGVAPRSVFGYSHLARAYLGLNRWQESRAALEQIIAAGEDNFHIYWRLYVTALGQGDEAAAQQYVAIAKKKIQGGETEGSQFSQAELAAYQGQLRTARELSEGARQSAEARGFRQNEGAIVAQEARWEAQVGNLQRARERAKLALGKARGIDVELNAAVALAMAGDPRSAETARDDLVRRYPEDSVLNAVSLPLIRSAIELERGNADQAIESLKMSERYELGFGFYYYPALMPTYLRGQAYLRKGDGARAAEQFQKILDHRGVGPVSLNYPLAHLGLGRAKVLAGDIHGAKMAYEGFFTLWKDADPEIPLLRKAKVEYAKLQ